MAPANEYRGGLTARKAFRLSSLTEFSRCHGGACRQQPEYALPARRGRPSAWRVESSGLSKTLIGAFGSAPVRDFRLQSFTCDRDPVGGRIPRTTAVAGL
jgi:hypothetical protein